jgi:hypothetical protein
MWLLAAAPKAIKGLEAGFRYNFYRCPQLAQNSYWPDVVNRITSSIGKVRYWMTTILTRPQKVIKARTFTAFEEGRINGS